MNKPKKFKSLISKIITQLNDIVSEINSKLKMQKSLFVHTITLKLNLSKNTLNVFLNSNPTPSSEIKLDPTYMQDILKQLNEILNKVHFFNYHIRIIIMEEKTSMIYLELQSKSLTLPNFSEIINYDNGIYANFSLSDNDETIIISNGEKIIDKVEVVSLLDNLSYGKTKEGWKYFVTPTPGYANTTASFDTLGGTNGSS